MSSIKGYLAIHLHRCVQNRLSPKLPLLIVDRYMSIYACKRAEPKEKTFCKQFDRKQMFIVFYEPNCVFFSLSVFSLSLKEIFYLSQGSTFIFSFFLCVPKKKLTKKQIYSNHCPRHLWSWGSVNAANFISTPIIIIFILHLFILSLQSPSSSSLSF